MKTLTSAVAVLLLANVITGCTGIRPYSETRDQQGKALQEAWKEAKVSEEIAVAQKNLIALKKEQDITSDRLIAARRAAAINAIVAGGTVKAKLFEKIDDALSVLAGSPEIATSLVGASKLEELAHANVDRARQLLSQLDVEVPDCVALKTADVRSALEELGATNGVISAYIKDLIQACSSKDLEATAGIKLPSSSALANTRADQASQRNKIYAAKINSLAARLRFRAAVLAYDSARERASSDLDAQAKTTTALKKAQDAFEHIHNYADKYSLGFLSKERAAAIDRFFNSVLDAKEGQPLPESAGNAALFFRLFPGWLDETKKAIADGRTPALQPLLMRRDYEKAQADAIERDIKSEESELVLIESISKLQLEQIKSLVSARRAESSPNMASVLGQTFRTVLGNESKAKSKIPSDTRATLIEATGYYLDAQYRIGGEINKVWYSKEFVKRERPLIYAEANLTQWTTLIGGSVDQLAAYGHSGIKAETVVSFVNAVSLLWIGKGVN